MHNRKQSMNWRLNTKDCCKLLTIAILLFVLSACSSVQPVQCQQPTVPAWVMEKQPDDLNLHQQLYEALTE